MAKWSPASRTLCKCSSPCWYSASLIELLPSVRDPVIRAFRKDLPWKPNNKSKKLSHQASSATCFSSRPLHTQPHGDCVCTPLPLRHLLWLLLVVKTIDQPQPAEKAQPAWLWGPWRREKGLRTPEAYSLTQMVLMTWNVSGKSYEQVSHPTLHLHQVQMSPSWQGPHHFQSFDRQMETQFIRKGWDFCLKRESR
jgi:hypothetical protein